MEKRHFKDQPITLIYPQGIPQVEEALITEAKTAIETGKVPEHAIKTRAARGGKLDYVSHTWATRTVQRALPPLWSYDVVSYEIFEQPAPKGESVIALVRWSDYVPYHDELADVIRFIERSVTEGGAYTNDLQLPAAMAINSAISMGISRCLFRMYGIGSEFYEKQEELTPEQHWTILKNFALREGLTKEQIKERVYPIMEEEGITRENIARHHTAMLDIISQIAQENVSKKRSSRNKQIFYPEENENRNGGSGSEAQAKEETITFQDVSNWVKRKEGLDFETAQKAIQDEFGPYDPEKAPEYLAFLKERFSDPVPA